MFQFFRDPWQTVLHHSVTWWIEIPSTMQLRASAVSELVQPANLFQRARFHTGVRAAVESHHSVSNFPALLGTTISDYNSCAWWSMCFYWLGIPTSASKQWLLLGPLLLPFGVHSENQFSLFWCFKLSVDNPAPAIGSWASPQSVGADLEPVYVAASQSIGCWTTKNLSPESPWSKSSDWEKFNEVVIQLSARRKCPKLNKWLTVP